MKKQLHGTILLSFSIAALFSIALNGGPQSPRTKRTPLAGIVTFPAVEHNEWEKVQLDPSLKDADKIVNTIDTFFNLKFKSRMKHVLLDFGFLFDRKSANGAEDYAYERGLCYSWIIAWRERTPPDSIESYKYEPKYSQLSIDKNKANVRVSPKAQVVSSALGGMTLNASLTEHTFTLIRKGGQWLVNGIVCSDEMRKVYPPGTDFNAAIREARKKSREWQKNKDIEKAG